MIKRNASTVLRYVLIAVVLSFPTVLLMLPTGRRSSVYILLLCALICIACRINPSGKTFPEVLKKYWLVNLAMAGMLIAVLLHHFAYGDFPFKPSENVLQRAAFPLFIWTLLLLSVRDLRLIEWALISGAILCSAALYWITHEGSVRSVGVVSSPLIPFTNLTLLMGFLALVSIGWNNRAEKCVILLKVLAWCTTLYASYISGTRGAWLAIPVYVIIAISFQKGIRNSHNALISLAAAVVIAAAMMFLPYTKARIEQAYSEIISYSTQTNTETSVGIRLQLWVASWNMFRDNPILGTGAIQYEREVKRLAAEGVITPQAGLQPHAHNDLVHALTTFGVIGAMAILALYFVPVLWFLKFVRSPDSDQRIAAKMGLTVCVGYFVYGMTDTLLYWNSCSAFYTIAVAILFALLIKRQEELGN